MLANAPRLWCRGLARLGAESQAAGRTPPAGRVEAEGHAGTPRRHSSGPFRAISGRLPLPATSSSNPQVRALELCPLRLTDWRLGVCGDLVGASTR